MNSESIWKVISVICVSALLGGVIERSVFAEDKASDRDMKYISQKLDTAINRIDSMAERLSKVEGKLDVALNQARRESRIEHKD